MKNQKGLARLVTAKGFTIIELVVVISIIAILAAIVITNVTQNINKGKDSSAKADMNKLLSDITNFYITNGSFNGVLVDSDYLKTTSALTKINYTVTAVCDNPSTCNSGTPAAWCAYITLKSTTSTTPIPTYCIDSAGNKTEKNNGSCSSEGACN